MKKLLSWLAGLAGYELVSLRSQTRIDTHLKALLVHLDINVVVDVGANTGQYAKRLRQLGYTGRIISYEPLNALRNDLERAADADPEWIVRPVAAGEEAGRATLRMSPDSSWSSLKPFTDYARRRFPSQDRDAQPEDVQIVRLDADLPSLISDIAMPRLFMKLDTQGFDAEAFTGASGVHSHVQALQAEVAFLSIYDDTPRYAESLKLFEDAGFTVTGLFPVKRDKATLCMIEMDCVMRRCGPDTAV